MASSRGCWGRLSPTTGPRKRPPTHCRFLGWLEAVPDRVGWFGWYALVRGDEAAVPVLVGGGGFLGPPRDGVAHIGYSVLPQFQRQGYATEMVRALVNWALGQQGMVRIVAETEGANPASVRVLEKAGFVSAGPTAEPGGTRFELSGGTATAEP